MTTSFRLMILCMLMPGACGAAGAGRASLSSDAAMTQAANQILRHQVSDGAIVLGALPAPESRVSPYFGNFAGLGLVTAYRATHDPHYLAAAQRWCDWYEAHQNADGTVNDYTGEADAWRSTGDYDATDSYAATYLDLVLAIYRAKADGAWMRAKYRSVTRAVAGIRLTLQTSGLTIAKPTYPIMYTMDNVETVQGLRAAAEIYRVAKDRAAATKAIALARGMDAALTRDLWDPAHDCYLIGMQTDGYRFAELKKWYPDVMANLMAVGWRPRTERHRSLFARLKAQFGGILPATLRTEDDLEHLCWWGFAARGTGDKALSLKITDRLCGFEAVLPSVSNPGLLGHLCRLLAQSKE